MSLLIIVKRYTIIHKKVANVEKSQEGVNQLLTSINEESESTEDFPCNFSDEGQLHAAEQTILYDQFCRNVLSS